MFKKADDQKLLDAYYKALSFCNLIKDELSMSSKIYGEDDAESLKQAFHILLKRRDYFEFYKYIYASRIMHLIRNIQKDSKILDAGCGIGTEAILCGILGGNAIGVDISRRLDFARKRIKFYENKSKNKIKVKFYKQNILKHSGEYDLIWVSEAISHISPVGTFFKRCFNNLKIGGKLIIADGNFLNPYTYFLSKKAQKKGGGVYTTKKDPITGEDILYARERYFSIIAIKNILTKNFNVDDLYPFGYFPYYIFNKFKKTCRKIEDKFLRKVPILRLLSGSYVIICSKINNNYKIIRNS